MSKSKSDYMRAARKQKRAESYWIGQNEKKDRGAVQKSAPRKDKERDDE